MTDNSPNELDRPSELFYAIQGLPDWREVFSDVTDPNWSPIHRQAGSLLSTILVATDEGRSIVAVAGELYGEKGYLAAVTTTGVVYADCNPITHQRLEFSVTLHPFSDVEEVTINADHVYFRGTEESPRHRRLTMALKVAGRTATFKSHGVTPLTTGDDVFAAMKTVRDGRASS
ncbi:hypothetical protein [Microbacterium immunditiarum]|uniref:Uncharacterized protein n=1 Tax=Microbacterium immunditiarum TaxID=337480 RepID=A0A7Y9GMZ5_9MICO|nr:hypothetical protein [Microbacterium immunditiarum]NYE19456.1 hypothetical protein [Microbacterium immunditiarum]